MHLTPSDCVLAHSTQDPMHMMQGQWGAMDANASLLPDKIFQNHTVLY